MNDFRRGEILTPDEPRMRPEMVAQLVVYLLAEPRVAQAASGLLAPMHFAVEPHFRILWERLQALIAAYGAGKVPYDAIMTSVAERIAEDPVPLASPLQAMLLATPDMVGAEMFPGDPSSLVARPGVIHHAYREYDPADAGPEFGIDVLRRFLSERAVVDEAVRAVSRAGDRLPGDFRAAIRRVSDADARVQSIGMPTSYGFDSFPEEMEPIATFPTGVSYFDHFLDGGHAGGELYVLLGPQKAGKTFEAVELCVGAAEHFHATAAPGEAPRTAVLVTFELSFRELRYRVLARGADVMQTRLAKEINPRKGSDYSSRGALLPYEEEMYRRRGLLDFASLPGERERIARFNETAGRLVRVIDASGKDGNRNVGYGGVDEIAGLLRQLEAEGRPPGLLVVDYINKAVRRQLGAQGKDDDRFVRPAILRFITEAIDKVAAPFDIPVWLLQQYSAEGQEAKPTKKLRATNAAEARTVGENANAVFCMGTRDEETKVLRIGCDLCRRTDKAGQSRLIRLDYEWSRFRDVTSQFDVDDAEGVFIPKDAAKAAAAVDPTKFAPPAPAQGSPDPYKHPAAGKPKAGTDHAF